MESRESKSCSGDYKKKSSFAILRSQDREYKSRVKKEGQMIKLKKHLKEQIYNNSNIFQVPDIKFNRKTAQNMIWQKNYKLKMSINILREENSSLKAKLWNIEKENRRMDKQIQSWNLDKVFVCSNKKPYIDMATVCKVFQDQDYQIVSIKIDIAKLQNIVKDKENQIQSLNNKVKQTEKFMGILKHYSTQQKIKLLTLVRPSTIEHQINEFSSQVNEIKNEQSRAVVACSERIDFLKKNLQLKKKMNLAHLQEKQNIAKQLQCFDNINEEEIEMMKQKMRKIKIEEQSQIKEVKKSLKSMKKNNEGFECDIQGEMGRYIREKIQVNKQIEELMEKIESQFAEYECYDQKIQTEIRKLN